MYRLGVFILNNNTGKIDKYITYLLEKLSDSLSNLVIVCSEMLKENERQKLLRFTDNFCLCNKGDFDNDISIYRSTILNIFNYVNIKEYDEIVFFNNSFYGPIYPIDEVFNSMSVRNLGFWGLTEYSETKDFPPHLQTYFFAIKKTILQDERFIEFWKDNSICDMALLTPYLEKLGYKWDVYSKAERFNYSPNNNFDKTLIIPYELLIEYNFPFLMKRCFNEAEFNNNDGLSIRKAFDYIKNHTDYDIDLIWQNIIAERNVRDIYESLKLDYILPGSYRSNENIQISKTAILIHIYYYDLIEPLFEYIKNIPNEIDLYFSYSKQDNQDEIIRCCEIYNKNNYYFIHVQNRGRDIAALLVGFKDYYKKYDYLCFLHDKKSSSKVDPIMIRSWMNNCFSNLINSEDYIYNVINLFKKNKYLGMLSTPFPMFEDFIGVEYNSWGSNFENTVNLCKQLNLTAILSSDKLPMSLTTMFWCRTNALKNLFENDFIYEDFDNEPLKIDGTISHAIERVFPYVAQHNGSYSAICMNDDYASVNMVNYNIITRTVYNILKKRIRDFSCFSEINTFLFNDIISLREKCKYLFIYGVGVISKRAFEHLQENNITIEGFVVTNIHNAQSSYCGLPVYSLSNLSNYDNIGFVIGISKEYNDEIISSLKERGFYNYTCYMK